MGSRPEPERPCQPIPPRWCDPERWAGGRCEPGGSAGELCWRARARPKAGATTPVDGFTPAAHVTLTGQLKPGRECGAPQLSLSPVQRRAERRQPNRLHSALPAEDLEDEGPASPTDLAYLSASA